MMSNDWNKVEQPLDSDDKQHKPSKEAAPSAPTREVLDSDFGGNAEPLRSPLRYTAGGRRRGRYRFAAPLGLLVILLTLVGAVSVVYAGVRAIQKSQDDTALRDELYYFVQPLAQYNPSAFTDVNETKQDALLLAAIWRVTEAESIRLRQDSDAVSAYALDDLGRMLIPVSEIEASYLELFGSGSTIYHHTIGEEGQSFTVEFDEAASVYHVPSMSTSMYVIVLDTVKKKGDSYAVRVGYVLSTNIAIDNHGNEIKPTSDMAEYFQVYTVQRVGETGWRIVSIADEGATTQRSETTDTDVSGSESAATAATTTATTTTKTKASA